MTSCTIIILAVFALQVSCAVKELYPPDVTIIPFNQQGFRVLIDHQDGMVRCAFHGNLNIEFDGREAGIVNREIRNHKDRKWNFADRSLKLRAGNIIYYWLQIDFNDGERTEGHTFDGSYTVQAADFEDDENAHIEQFKIPQILIEPLSPRGLRASIPNAEGIKLFSFHVNINKPMEGKDAGQHAKDVLKAKDGKWTFLDRSIKLKKGDILYYWYYVLHTSNGVDNLGYEKVNKMFNVATLIYEDPGTTTTTQRTTTVKTTKPKTLKPGCEETVTKINGGKTSCKNNVLLQENFGKINENKWQTEVRFADAPDFNFNSYTNDPSIIYTQKNYLYIKPQLADVMYGPQYVTSSEEINLGLNCTGKVGSIECSKKSQAYIILPPVVSARINTSPHLSFKYGHVEIRAKLPKGNWLYPELILRPKSYVYGPGHSSGEIKIAFMPGNKNMSSRLYGGIAFGDSDKARAYGLKYISSQNVFNDDFHIFTCIWTPDGITVKIDEDIYGSIQPPEGGYASLQNDLELEGTKLWSQGTKFAPFDQEMVLAIGVGAGGHMFPDTDDKPYSNADPKAERRFYSNQTTWRSTWSGDSELVVDYVKILAL